MRKTVLNLKTLVPISWHSLVWHFKYYILNRGFPMACGIFLTNRCNLKCAMCSIWADRSKSTLSLEQVKTFIDAVTPGLCYLSFSGGEPLLVKDLMDMISYASKRIPYVHLVTNGLLIDENSARELARAGLDEISISLDGEKEWHDKLRNSGKSFDAAVNAMDCIKRAAPEIEIVANTVIFPDRLDQASRAVEITGNMGVRHKVQPVNRHFLFKDSKADNYKLDFNNVDMSAVLELVNTLKRNPRIVNSRLYLNNIPEYFSRRLKCPMIKKGCKAPNFFIEVSSYGRVSPCMIATGWNGTLNIDNDLKKNLGQSSYLKEKKRLESCRKCDDTMYICYWEPMTNFPLFNFIKYGLLGIHS
jgi:MoaA/NifB/PqqE/SkfB family radical SAM enzyme